MEHFVVSARKYRPETFEDVVGQKAITNTLLNAIENNHLAQALLFTGPRGVGKTTCARILAKKINQQATENKDEDYAFNIFELDAASNNSVDDIRNLIDQVRIPPQVGKYKVYIIDEVHMLSSSAFNAFLKTLEEPPKHAIFILATTEKHKIIPTILSRCQIFDFKRITVTDAKEYLAKIAENEGVNAEDDALHIIAQKADGAMRDALSIYDRVVSFSGNNLTREAVTENLNVLDYETYFKSTDFILKNDIPGLLVQYNEILAKGFDGHHYIAGLASHFRDLLVCKNQATISLLEVGEQVKTLYFKQSQEAPQEFLMQAIDLANECDLKYKTSRNPRLLVELCLMQLASITFDGEKKNSKRFIIPAENFISTEKIPAKKIDSQAKEVIQTNEHPEPQKATAVKAKLPSEEKESTTTVQPEKNSVKVDLSQRKRPSGLSLKSIGQKKEHEQKQKEKQALPTEELTEAFTEEQIQEAWAEYVEKLSKRGKKILASIVDTDKPTLVGKTIHIELPNDTMKIELKKAQGNLMNFIKKRIQNTTIKLEIDVNEKATKKYAFTTRDKFEKLKEKNPLIDKLRTTFDLDI
ncbi:DNA polymerase III subunit gamma/tau [Mesonia sp.]|uniref:DNA polymerase III subunit gamma/tau n=2 Tax=Mesonia TaxID=232115 RepID=UPI001765E612|nr:DNA polymerase III subunit gamma/tau [Mesonia sp.]HIB37223.1 DNA polymerase III subunit gamma/tau [Mesonia sp.]HIO27154.1 DNA polymerase III subunit gamma/tau [Flavobacteriaceae bacterium]